MRILFHSHCFFGIRFYFKMYRLGQPFPVDYFVDWGVCENCLLFGGTLTTIRAPEEPKASSYCLLGQLSLGNSPPFPFLIITVFGHEYLRGAQWIQSLFLSMLFVAFSSLMKAARLRRDGVSMWIYGTMNFFFGFLTSAFSLENVLPHTIMSLLWNVRLGTEPIVCWGWEV